MQKGGSGGETKIMASAPTDNANIDGAVISDKDKRGPQQNDANGQKHFGGSTGRTR